MEQRTRKSALLFGKREAKSPPSWLVILRGSHGTPSSLYYSYGTETKEETSSDSRRSSSSRHRRPPTPRVYVEGEPDDIVEVIEEHSLSERAGRRRRDRRAAGFRLVDPNLYGGGIRERKIQRTEFSIGGEEPATQEDAERLMDEFLTTFTKAD